MAFERKAAHLAQPIHEQLRDKVRHADILHADETHWRIDGKNAYAQNRQSCLAHLIRKAREISDLISALPRSRQHPPDLLFCQRIKTFLSRACEIGRHRDVGKLSFTDAKDRIPALYRRLQSICASTLHHPDAENLRQRLLDPSRDYHRLFTFLKINRMPPTNNYAEQILRHPVIFRKIIFGNRSELGARALEINLSVFNTIKCRCLNPIPLIKDLFLHGHRPLAKALFDDSS